eukprot:TRINITY_DN3_c0_g1_i1.p1 TRINITY_DN3_c0_g1~~TRINITY_DN3_c0_g1_i1.p1  ORF type:complete len:784 (+),score=262.55 TRINITY_DN3_c0_g1_i1:90-2354(+)
MAAAACAPHPPAEAPALPAAKRPRVEPESWRADWPLRGCVVDLAKHDLPHASSALEWWYYNAHLTTAAGEPYTLFVSFFRRMKSKGQEGYYSSVLWAITDVTGKRYYPDSLLDRAATEVIMAEIEGKKDPHTMERAVYEMCKKGSLPYPDRLMQGDGECADGRLSLKFDDCTLEKTADGSYVLDVRSPVHGTRAELSFVPQKPAQLHGEDGVVNDMFYYFIPRCAVTGHITVQGQRSAVEGSGWYDHEFGGKDDDSKNTVGDGWNWISLQLSDGSDLTIFVVSDEEKGQVKENVAVLVDAKGQRKVCKEFSFTPVRRWTSMQTFMEHVVDWQLDIPEEGLQLSVKAAADFQEFQTVVVGTGGGFWEGRVDADGTKAGQPLTGRGYLERKGFTPYRNTKQLLKSVGKVVRDQLQKAYPTDCSLDYIEKVVLGRHSTTGVEARDVCDTLFKPVRALLDRGGKSWRSMILVSAMTAINKYFTDTSRWVILPELVHVASLIVDDIQDESTIRRGGPCVHLTFGVAHAINAASAVFFLSPELGGVRTLPPAKQLELYHLYMEMLRAGHAGQGLDMLGLDHMMPEAVRTGENAKLIDRLNAIHKLKTGGPAGSLCRMATMIVDGTDAQADALEKYGLSLGLAFQIVDDALNLRGFEGDLKEVGEDIRDGKVTYPVVLALPKLSRKDREWLWATLQSRPTDPATIKACIALLDKVDAIDDSLEAARRYVQEAWEAVDPYLEDSLPKLMMRSFGMYLVDRTW